MSEVTTYYLQTLSPEELVSRPQPPGVELRECITPIPEFNKFLYELVGQPWQWFDKSHWTSAAWHQYVERDELRTWVIYKEGTPAGYFELEKQADTRVEIAYFGLVPTFIGSGLGGYLLTCAIREGWAWGASAIIVNTCSLDHPSALRNYQSRGMQVYHSETRRE